MVDQQLELEQAPTDRTVWHGGSPGNGQVADFAVRKAVQVHLQPCKAGNPGSVGHIHNGMAIAELLTSRQASVQNAVEPVILLAVAPSGMGRLAGIELQKMMRLTGMADRPCTWPSASEPCWLYINTARAVIGSTIVLLRSWSCRFRTASSRTFEAPQTGIRQRTPQSHRNPQGERSGSAIEACSA